MHSNTQQHPPGYPLPHQQFDIEQGPGAYQTHILLKDSEFDVRQGFIKKVYSIIAFQLLATSFLAYYAMSTVYTGFGYTLLNNPWALWLMMAVNIVVMLMVLCSKHYARTVPTNYVLLGIFTFTEAWMVSYICAMYEMMDMGDLVLMACFMTAGMTIALTLYAFTTKSDFTMRGGSLFIFSCALFLFALFAMFSRNPILHIIVAVGVIVFYGYYLIYDTQLIMGGKMHELSVDDYIVGAIIIYVDIIVLFLRILQILALVFGKRRN